MKKLLLFILILNFMFLFSCSENIKNIKNIENVKNTEISTETEIITTTENIIRQPEKLYDFDVVYDEYNNLKMDIYYPTNIKYVKSPLIIAFHGGGWVAGDKSQPLYMFTPLIKELLENGYTFATAQYRYASETTPFPNQIQDAIKAIKYLENNAELYNIDKDSVGIMGYSAGAQLAMLAAYSTEEYFGFDSDSDYNYNINIKYCISFAGPTKMYDDDVNNYARDIIYLLENLFQCKYEENPDKYKSGSPYYYLTGENIKKIPLLLAHDEKDDVVPFSQSQIMYDKAIEIGIDCELLKLIGFRHQIDLNSGRGNEQSPSVKTISPSVKTILDFIYKYSGK